MAKEYYEYVAGFAFAQDQVLLIEKKRPVWQAERLNGIGGHIEPDETPGGAMQREFSEETGIATVGWNHFATLHVNYGRIYFFYLEGKWEYLRQARSTTDERICWVNPHSVNAHNAIPNLTWLIPMAMNLRHEISPRKAIRIELTEIYE
jgi:8-oxo-dGTP pyrophosphatase MutT (NUDIX family)